MLYMVIERPRNADFRAVGARFRERGRMMPESVKYIASWWRPGGDVCYQIMESPSRAPLDEWIANWRDLVDFEVHEVETSADFWARVNGTASSD